MKVEPNVGILPFGPVNRVKMEVSLISETGRKITRYVEKSAWQSILNDCSKSMRQVEDELIVLLSKSCETFEQREHSHADLFGSPHFEGPFENLLS